MTRRRRSGKPSSQIVGQLPRERVTPGHVFDQVGVDYAGPLMLKLGSQVICLHFCIYERKGSPFESSH